MVPMSFHLPRKLIVMHFRQYRKQSSVLKMKIWRIFIPIRHHNTNSLAFIDQHLVF